MQITNGRRHKAQGVRRKSAWRFSNAAIWQFRRLAMNKDRLRAKGARPKGQGTESQEQGDCP